MYLKNKQNKEKSWLLPYFNLIHTDYFLINYKLRGIHKIKCDCSNSYFLFILFSFKLSISLYIYWMHIHIYSSFIHIVCCSRTHLWMTSSIWFAVMVERRSCHSFPPTNGLNQVWISYYPSLLFDHRDFYGMIQTQKSLVSHVVKTVYKKDSSSKIERSLCKALIKPSVWVCANRITLEQSGMHFSRKL